MPKLIEETVNILIPSVFSCNKSARRVKLLFLFLDSSHQKHKYYNC